ncbi:MAG: fibrobacter succinogenes major paralogous domain-containing protein [Bacteroidetes bacterium]|nr:fibrobacter succinogenes major paralogous domain-containing protein [Bacteroidota bacterium]
MNNSIQFFRNNSSLRFLLFFLLYFVLGLSACKDDDETTPMLETGTMIDVDGNIYKTVLIGGKWWMAENLRVKHYRDGQAVNELVEDTTWSQGAAAYSVHPDATTAMGYLYNWEAVSNTAGLAPDGWHIATDEEWKQLESAVGMESSEIVKTGWRGSIEGDALKAEGTDNWNRFDPVWATNSSGFTALSGSCRLYNGKFGYPGRLYTGFWWTASENIADNSKAWYRYLDYKTSEVFRQYLQKEYGMSVRCVKD